MAVNLKIQGNFFVLYDATSGEDVFTAARSDVRFYQKNDGKDDYFYFRSIYGGANYDYKFSDIIDDRTGSAFISVDSLNEFLRLNLGSQSGDVTSGISDNYVFVRTKQDLPDPVSEVITLQDNTAYLFVSNVDLTGDRLVGGDKTAIIGTSSETASITSTGLTSTDYLLTTTYTTPIQNITFKNHNRGVNIDGLGNGAAIDWYAVNFLNITEIGIIKNTRNFIYTSGAFLNSQDLKFDGTTGTISFFGSFLSGDGTTVKDIIKVLSTATIERRFRIFYSTVNVVSPTTGINVDVGATIDNNAFILDTVNFEGGGTYLTGLDYSSNKASFSNCTSIINSDEVAQYYMNGNTTATTITTIGEAVKAAGTTTAASFNQKFDHTDNKATYVGSRKRFFKVTATLSVNSGNNNEIGIYIAKNGTLLTESEIYVTTNAGGRAENGTVQTILELEQNDYIEIFVENDSSTTDVTVTELNVIVD